MSQKFLSGTEAVRAGFAATAVFCGVLTAGLWCDRLYQWAVQPMRGVIETVEPGTWSDCPNGGLTADPESLNFGRMMQGTPFGWNLKLSNRTNKTVRISKFETSCGISAWNQADEISHGETILVRISHRNYGSNPADIPSERHDRRLVIPVLPDHPGRHPGWQVSGMIVTADNE